MPDDYEQVYIDRDEMRARLAAVESILGLLPGGPDWQARAVYLAFQVARDGFGEPTRDAAQRLEVANPDWIAGTLVPSVNDPDAGLALSELVPGVLGA